MFISMNWIKDFVDLSGLDLEALIRRFTLSTAEVEDIYKKGEDIEGVVSAKILSVSPHPNSKKLHLLKVDAGDGVYDVVCGAPNAREGIIVPFVKEGGMVMGERIGAARIAGYDSHGMCCSEKEIGISQDHSGLMELPDDTPIGADLCELFEIRDTVFEIDNKSLTNRPDLWGHYGIAREFAALTGRELKPLETVELSAFDSLSPIEIEVLDKELCYRYSGLKVRNITKKISPVNMRIRLYYCGSRAINLLADLTNYLMLEMGQPMHAFDASKVSRIEVKRFSEPFNFKTLDGTERRIDENTLMICSLGEPVAVAGIMGGLNTEIEDSTDSLLLESANFDAVSVRRSAVRLGLRTDASMRYEKCLDPEMTVTAIARFIKLLLDIDPGAEVCSRLTDVYVRHFPKVELSFDREYVDRYTGISISDEEILKTLKSLGFGAKLSGGRFTVDVPSYRATKDVTIKADIIEEITRVYGYDNFKVSTTLSPLAPKKRSPQNRADSLAKDILVKRYSLHEIHSYIWTDLKKCKDLGIEPEENIRLLNPQNPDNELLRTCMGPTLLWLIKENRSFAAEYGIFEIGRVCLGKDENGLALERKSLGIALYSRIKGERELYYSLLEIFRTLAGEIKGVELDFENCEPVHSFEHPVNTAKISYDGQYLGRVCALHPTVAANLDRRGAAVLGELYMDAFSEIPGEELNYLEPSRFPGIDVDVSLLLPDGLSFRELSPAWENELGGILSGVKVIDLFNQGGKRSVTLRFSFVSPEKTLTREEVTPLTDGIISKLTALGAVQRA